MPDNSKFVSKTGLSYFFNRIKTVFASKTEFNTLSGKVDDIISTGGEPNVIEAIKVNGAEQTITNKAVDISVPDTEFSSNGANIRTGDKRQGIFFEPKNYGIMFGGTHDEGDYSNVLLISKTYAESTFQTQEQVQEAIAAAVSTLYDYKGSVATVADLPTSGNKKGDVYDVLDTGVNYAWDGTKWDPLGQLIDLSILWAKSELVAVTTAEIDAIIDGQ